MGEAADKAKKLGLGEDFSKALGYAESIYSIVNPAYQVGMDVATRLGFLDKPENPLNILLDQIKIIIGRLDEILADLEKIRKAVVDGSKLSTRTSIYNEVSDANGSAGLAKDYLDYPNDPEIIVDFGHARDSSYNAANRFKDNIYLWKRIYVEEAVYNDGWSGTLYPEEVTPQKGNTEGLIWDYRLLLIAYLGVLADRCIVLSASSQEEKKAHRDELKYHAEFLTDVYLKIIRNFHPIKPPSIDEMIYVIPAIDDANFYWLGIDSVKYYFTPGERDNLLENWIPEGRWRRFEYIYGMVEKHTGYVCKSSYPQDEIRKGAYSLVLLNSFMIGGAPGAGANIKITQPEAFKAFYDQFVLRHRLRTRKQGTNLYIELGFGSAKVFVILINFIRMWKTNMGYRYFLKQHKKVNELSRGVPPQTIMRIKAQSWLEDKYYFHSCFSPIGMQRW